MGRRFMFDRQNTWGAQNPFTQWVKETKPATETAVPDVRPLSSYTPPGPRDDLGPRRGRPNTQGQALLVRRARSACQRNDPGLAMVKHPYLVQPAAPASSIHLSPDRILCSSLRRSRRRCLHRGSGFHSNNPVAEGLNAYSGVLTALDGLLGPAPRYGRSNGWGLRGFDGGQGAASVDAGRDWRALGLARGWIDRLSEVYGTSSFGSSKASEEWLMARWEAFLTPNLLAVTQASVERTILPHSRGSLRHSSRPFWTRTYGASCRRSPWTRATDSPSAIRRGSVRGAIPTNI